MVASVTLLVRQDVPAAKGVSSVLTHKETVMYPQSADAADVTEYIWQNRPPDSSTYVASQLEDVRGSYYAPVPKLTSELPVVVFEDWSAIYFNRTHHRWEAVSAPWVGGNVHRSRRQRRLRQWLRQLHRASVTEELPF